MSFPNTAPRLQGKWCGKWQAERWEHSLKPCFLLHFRETNHMLIETQKHGLLLGEPDVQGKGPAICPQERGGRAESDPWEKRVKALAFLVALLGRNENGEEGLGVERRLPLCLRVQPQAIGREGHIETMCMKRLEERRERSASLLSGKNEIPPASGDHCLLDLREVIGVGVSSSLKTVDGGQGEKFQPGALRVWTWLQIDAKRTE